jgi:beta-lactamase class A
LTDSSSETGFPSIENYIKKILLVSDNDAYNRLYEFVGRAEINQKLKKYGLNKPALLAG